MRWRRADSGAPTGSSGVEVPLATAAVEPSAAGLRCDRSGCAETTAVACRYLDRRGRHCLTAWCPAHQVQVGGRGYCARHGTLMAAVPAGTLLAAPLPDVDNRAPSLLLEVGRGVDHPISNLLGERCGPGSEVTSLPVRLTYVGSARARTWTRRWALASHLGVSLSVAMLVDEERPAELRAAVDGNDVMVARPPWIDADAAARADATGRDGFHEAILAAVRSGVAARLAASDDDAARLSVATPAW